MAKASSKDKTSSAAGPKPATSSNIPVITAASEDRILNVQPDMPDIRDRIYEPSLLDLRVTFDPQPATATFILDQGAEGACTGFALAAAINHLLGARCRLQVLTPPSGSVSPRMLYEMARLHDEWPGENYQGSSIRGALKGFFHNGVCSEASAPYRWNQRNWHLTVGQAKEARSIGLGAYFRLRPEIIDYHCALNEAGVIIASAKVHSGWRNPAKGIIKQTTQHEGGHAFAIVGYDETGFIIQNSWGPSWGGYKGNPGLAHWCYRDWAENVVDAWVMRLAAPTPDAFDLTNRSVGRAPASAALETSLPRPKRQDITGHFIHLDDGKLIEEHSSKYPSPMASIQETADFLHADESRADPKYDHLMFYCHGGLNDALASARRILGMKEVFKRNRIYPVHFMWETGFTEELSDVFFDLFKKAEARVGFFPDATDLMIEKLAGGLGRRVWSQMKLDARRAFEPGAGGTRAVNALLKANAARKKPLGVHLVGHSAGSILLGEWLNAWNRAGAGTEQVDSVSLMAPACTVSFYDSSYRPALTKQNGKALVDKLVQYNLIDSRELDDNVLKVYRKSLLYLVSRAFEDEKKMPLLGMETYLESFKPPASHKIFYAGRHRSHTDSTSHGGFDNDRETMNDVLANILGRKPKQSLGFQPQEVGRY